MSPNIPANAEENQKRVRAFYEATFRGIERSCEVSKRRKSSTICRRELEEILLVRDEVANTVCGTEHGS